jgi:hypothetical protein
MTTALRLAVHPRLADSALEIRPLVTGRQFTDVLQVSDRTFRRMRAARIIPAPTLMIGRSPRWSAESVAAFIANSGRST